MHLYLDRTITQNYVDLVKRSSIELIMWPTHFADVYPKFLGVIL